MPTGEREALLVFNFMNLWQEMFNFPTPCEFTATEFNEAWNWLFSDKETAALKLTIARRHSLSLRRLGHVRSAEMAVCGLKRRNAVKLILAMPIRG